MKYASKSSHEVEAVQWRGVRASGFPMWLHRACDLARNQFGSIRPVLGTEEAEFRLNGGGLRIVQVGDYFVYEGGRVRVMSKDDFEGLYEQVIDVEQT